MATLTEARRTGEFIISEANGTRSREEITLAAAAGAMVAGTLLGKITATGLYTAYNNADSPAGVGVALGVLYAGVADVTVDQPAVMICRDAEVAEIFLTGSDTTGKTDLAALGVIVR
jgi:hypothetical protein